MRCLTTLITAVLIGMSGAAAHAAPKPKVSAAQSQLQAQIKKLTAERDGLKDRLAATESLQSDLAAAQKSRDMARQETDSVRKELDQMKSALAENQGSADTILKELQKAKEDLAAAQAANEGLRAAVADAVNWQNETAARPEQIWMPGANRSLKV